MAGKTWVDHQLGEITKLYNKLDKLAYGKEADKLTKVGQCLANAENLIVLALPNSSTTRMPYLNLAHKKQLIGVLKKIVRENIEEAKALLKVKQ